MPVTNLDKLASNVVSFHNETKATDNPYRLDWATPQTRIAITRLLTPRGGQTYQRESPAALAMLTWFLANCSGAGEVRGNPAKSLKGSFWLFRSYADLSRMNFTTQREVQKGIGLLRGRKILIVEKHFAGHGPKQLAYFRMTDDALQMARLLAHGWWLYRDLLLKDVMKDPDEASRVAKSFYADALWIAYDPPTDGIDSLPDLMEQWFLDRDLAAFEKGFRITLDRSAKFSGQKP